MEANVTPLRKTKMLSPNPKPFKRRRCHQGSEQWEGSTSGQKEDHGARARAHGDFMVFVWASVHFFCTALGCICRVPMGMSSLCPGICSSHRDFWAIYEVANG